MQSFIERGLRGLILAGIFALPFLVLVVSHELFFPFITGKNFLFRVLVEIMAGAWIALALVSPVYRPKKTWMLAAFAAFVLVMALADIFGVNPFKSIWSNFERMEGLVTLVHLFVLFVITSSILTTEKLWRRFWETSIVVSVIVGLYALLQLTGVLTPNQGANRLDATLGNATYLACYMIFHIFMTAVLWVQRWYEGNGRKLWSAIALSVLSLQILILFFTSTRGAMLGLLGGVLLSSFLLVLFAKNSRVVWRASAAVVAAIILLVGGFFIVKDQAWVQGIEPLQRLASISLEDNTTKARFMNWGMAWEGFKERPLLGWGQENYNIVFNQQYNPGMYAQEQWFDRTHNVFLDWLIAGGILGLATYLALFALALVMLWRSGAFTIPERALLTGLLAAYFVNNLFVFDNITSYLFFVFVLAYITARVTREKGTPALLQNATLLPASALPIAAAITLSLAVGSVFWINGAGYAQNTTLLQAVSTQEGIDRNLEYFAEAEAYGSYGTQEVREQILQGALSFAGNENVSAEVRQRIFEEAAEGMIAQSEASPLDARFPFFLGSLYAAYGQAAASEEALRLALSLSPNKQSIRYQLGLVLLAQEKNDEALALLKETYELETANSQAKVLYAFAAITLARDDIADPLVSELMADDAAGNQRIISAYASRGRYDKVAVIWSDYLTRHPDSTQAAYGLAAAYYAGGAPSQAIAFLQQFAEVTSDESVKNQIPQLIEQIRNGTLQVN